MSFRDLLLLLNLQQPVQMKMPFKNNCQDTLCQTMKYILAAEQTMMKTTTPVPLKYYIYI